MYAKALALPWLLALLSNCSSDFAPYSELDRLRVLGIRAEPATPPLGGACQLDALTFAPDGDAIAYHWWFCPVVVQAKDDFRCPLGEATAQEIFGTSPVFDLGTAETANFTNTVAPELLASFCANGIDRAGFAQAITCNPGYPVSIVLDVATSGDALRAAFTVNLPSSPTPEINTNPTVLGLSVGGQSLTEQPIQLSLPESRSVELSAQLSPDSVELRPIPPAEGGDGLRPERLTLSWFADTGTIDQARTVYIDGETTMDQATHNRWTAPGPAAWPAQGLVQLSVVVRDDRGGVGWLSRQIQLGERR
jgi:hypothetical protein